MSASLRRRMLFARDSFLFYDRLFTAAPLSFLSRFRDFQTPRLPDHLTRIAGDLVECLRTGRIVPELGNVELSLRETRQRAPQHPRYLCYWHDAERHAMVGMIVGADIIRHDGRYYVIELNQGPSLYARRRVLYDAPFDPVVAGIAGTARELGFERLVPIALWWRPPYVEEFPRAGGHYGIEVTPVNCPLAQPGGAPRMVALPDPLRERTLYAVHSGPAGAAFSYLDNKWYASKWLAEELPKESLAAIPATSDELFVPAADGSRWPNLVVKLAGSARSRHVLAARFGSVEEAREAFGPGEVPRQLRAGYLRNLLLYGRDRIVYQEFVPPELDERGHARMIRLHLFVSPLRTMYLSAHFRLSRRPVPESVPRGVIAQDDAFVFNDADYARLPPAIEEDMCAVARDLGDAMQRALERKFETGA